MVFPSSISFTAASTCHFSTFSSSLSFKIMSILALVPFFLNDMILLGLHIQAELNMI